MKVLDIKWLGKKRVVSFEDGSFEEREFEDVPGSSQIRRVSVVGVDKRRPGQARLVMQKRD